MLIKCCCNFYKYIWDFFQIFLFPCFQRFKFEDYVQFNALGLWLSSTVYSKFSVVVGVKKCCTCTLLCFFLYTLSNQAFEYVTTCKYNFFFLLIVSCSLTPYTLESVSIFIFFFQGDVILPAVPPPQESTLWAVKPAEKAKYDNIFEVSQPKQK